MELAGGFTDEKRFVGFGDEFEVVREDFLEPVESAALRPVGGRGEVFEPSAGRGEHDFAIGVDEGWEPGKKFFRMGEPTNQVGCKDAVKGAEVVTQVHGIALLELAAGGVESVR